MEYRTSDGEPYSRPYRPEQRTQLPVWRGKLSSRELHKLKRLRRQQSMISRTYCYNTKNVTWNTSRPKWNLAKWGIQVDQTRRCGQVQTDRPYLAAVLDDSQKRRLRGTKPKAIKETTDFKRDEGIQTIGDYVRIRKSNFLVFLEVSIITVKNQGKCPTVSAVFDFVWISIDQNMFNRTSTRIVFRMLRFIVAYRYRLHYLILPIFRLSHRHQLSTHEQLPIFFFFFYIYTLRHRSFRIDALHHSRTR